MIYCITYCEHYYGKNILFPSSSFINEKFSKWTNGQSNQFTVYSLHREGHLDNLITGVFVSVHHAVSLYSILLITDNIFM